MTAKATNGTKSATALVIAITGLVVSVGGFLKVWYDIGQVHTIVNSQRTAMEAKIEELRKLLVQSYEREGHAKETP